MNDRNDPVGRYLGENLTSVREPDPGRREPPWRPSLAKIAAWCAALVIVAGGGYLLATHTVGEPRMKVEHARVATEEHVEAQAAGRITLVVGEVARVCGGERSQPGVGDPIHAGDVFETASDASLGIEHAGHTVVLMERARLSVKRAPARELRVVLERGVIAARSSRNEGALRIEGRNADVVSRGAVFTVEASGSVLEKTSVAQGEVEVLSKEDRKDVHIARSSFLDMNTWTASAGQPEKEAIEVLVAHTGIELPEPEKIAKDALVEPDVPSPVAGSRPPAEDDQEGELDSKKAEREIIKDAEIRFRKMSDPEGAAKILDGYYEKYPQGAYLDEALYLDGAVHMKLGRYEEAKKIYERYLKLYPEGLQVVRVHLALAQILATKLSDCPGAMKHAEAIPTKSMAPPVAAKVQKVQKLCGVE